MVLGWKPKAAELANKQRFSVVSFCCLTPLMMDCNGEAKKKKKKSFPLQVVFNLTTAADTKLEHPRLSFAVLLWDSGLSVYSV